MVLVNGQPAAEAAGCNLKIWLEAAGYDLSRIVVERNLEIIPREALADEVIREEDTIEVLRFVGGG